MVESGKTLIVVLIRNLPEKSGGIQKGVFQLYDYLRKKGFEIEFVLSSKKENISEYDEFKINHIKFPPIYTYPFTKRYFEYIKQRKNIYNHFKINYTGKKVIVIAHWAPDFMLLAEIGFKLKYKTLFSFHGPYHTKKFKELYGRKAIWLRGFKNKINHINKFVFISNVLYKEGIERCNIPVEKSIVIQNGIVVNNEVSIKKNNDVVKFVMATRLVKNKNIDFVLESLTILKSKGLKFICDIYGDGTEEESLRSMITTNNLKGDIFLKGYKANIDKLLHNYDYYISASLFEGLPRGPLEAINNNVIPILSDIPTHREIIPAEVDVFFSLENPYFLADKINKIVNQNENNKMIREELKDYLCLNFDINIRNAKFKELILTLLLNYH
jgi:glycosyltransferase involved in cell wall biosynthesis